MCRTWVLAVVLTLTAFTSTVSGINSCKKVTIPPFTCRMNLNCHLESPQDCPQGTVCVSKHISDNNIKQEGRCCEYRVHGDLDTDNKMCPGFEINYKIKTPKTCSVLDNSDPCLDDLVCLVFNGKWSQKGLCFGFIYRSNYFKLPSLQDLGCQSMQINYDTCSNSMTCDSRPLSCNFHRTCVLNSDYSNQGECCPYATTLNRTVEHAKCIISKIDYEACYNLECNMDAPDCGEYNVCVRVSKGSRTGKCCRYNTFVDLRTPDEELMFTVDYRDCENSCSLRNPACSSRRICVPDKKASSNDTGTCCTYTEIPY